MPQPSPHSEKLRRAHPLAAELVHRVEPQMRVLEIGAGRGRNTDALREAGLRVQAIDDRHTARFEVQPNAFGAALSTHAFLHGTYEDVTAMVAAATRALVPGASLFCTFASKTDARYGRGTRVAEDTYAPESGDEAGVPHTYFDERGIRALLAPDYAIEEMNERAADEVVGTWAHAQRPSGTVHWFVIATRKRR